MTLLERGCGPRGRVAELGGRLAAVGPVRGRFSDEFNEFVRSAALLGDEGFGAAMRELAECWSSQPMVRFEEEM